MRKLIQKAVALSIVCAASVVSAQTADMPRPAPAYKAPAVVPIYNWNGFYIGGNVGWAFGNSLVTYNPTSATWDIGKDAFLGGVQARSGGTTKSANGQSRSIPAHSSEQRPLVIGLNCTTLG